MYNTLKQKFNTLSHEQINTLFQIYLCLDSNFDFFMSEKDHIEFINLYYQNPSNRNPSTFKTLISILINQYTYKNRYPDLLNAIEMLHKNYSFEKIVNTLLK